VSGEMDGEDWLGCAVLLLSPLLYLYDGWALSLLWLWFAVPALDVPALGVVQAAGLCLVVSFLRDHVQYRDHVADVSSNLALILTRPLIYVAVGWAFLWLFR
jgi:hypothetical protein